MRVLEHVKIAYFIAMRKYDHPLDYCFYYLFPAGIYPLSCCVSQDLHHCEVTAGVDFSKMALRYTACELLNLKGKFYLANYIYASCSHVGILRPKRYIHRSFSCLSSNTVAYSTFLHKSQRLSCRPMGVNFNNS